MDKQQYYFFVPRIGANYKSGFNGIRTLILGAYHVCYCNCEHKDICCNIDTVASMDYKCPAYGNTTPTEKPEDELCLHNSNIIEINSYCDDDARYPTYTAFTRYILNCKKGLTYEQKISFWDSVAFYNFYQCFSSADSIPGYNDIKVINKNAINALVQLINELHPEIIYVWTKDVNDIIENNIEKFPGLKKDSLFREHSTMELYKFSYCHKTNNIALTDIREYLDKTFPNREITLTPAGTKKRIPPLEKVLINAIKRKAFIFDNGKLTIAANRTEQEGGYILSQINEYYNITWKEIELIITKYGKNGKQIKNLRQIRRYNNNNDDANKIAEIDKHIFGIK